MMDGNDLITETSKRNVIFQAWTRISQVYQGILDKWTPHTKFRWVGSFLLLAVFLLRVFTKQGWYIVTYALGIYHLNLFIAFLTPKIDPAMDFDDDDNGPALPTRATEEFRPFIRRLPEFKFWLSVIKSTLFALCCTFVDAFNIPVFWPILVMYFITLFCITMKRQIKVKGSGLCLPQWERGVTVCSMYYGLCLPLWDIGHMVKYRYLPFTHSKPKYKTVNSTVTVN